MKMMMMMIRIIVDDEDNDNNNDDDDDDDDDGDDDDDAGLSMSLLHTTKLLSLQRTRTLKRKTQLKPDPVKPISAPIWHLSAFSAGTGGYLFTSSASIILLSDSFHWLGYWPVHQ
ncbi:hypothetical protein ElyMa_000937400 [Elysia marginata]|uniref:Uncharacterized protein n=1 Tax=Elysia marginata TaxID=1093978 RepID=A0AAV4HCA2_9GAST|nr:hypothetical protein ElyMa_000937400 [Elysia marginata]